MKNQFIVAIFSFIFLTISGNIHAQFADSISLEHNIITPIAFDIQGNKSHIIFGTDDLSLNQYVLNADGYELVSSVQYERNDLIKIVEKSIREEGGMSFDDVSIYSDKYAGSGLAGYFSPYTFVSKSYNKADKDNRKEMEWKIPLEETKIDVWHKSLMTEFIYDGNNYSVLVAGHKIKKDKEKKKNEYRDYDVFIVNSEQEQKFQTNFETKYGVVPRTAGVVTDQAGNFEGFYVEFDLGTGAEGLSKMNKDATKHSKFIALLDKEGNFVREVEANLPVKLGMLTRDEIYVKKALLIDGKLHIYISTMHVKFANVGDWLPGYFYFVEDENAKFKYAENYGYEDYKQDYAYHRSGTLHKLNDLSDVVQLNNGNLLSFGTSNGIQFSYTTTKADGTLAKYGNFATSITVPETIEPYKYVIHDLNSEFYGVLIYQHYSSMVNGYFFINKESGEIIPINPAEQVVNKKTIAMARGVASYGVSKTNSKAIHIAYSPNHFFEVLNKQAGE